MPDEDRSNVEGRMRMLEAGLNELAVRLRMLEERLGARPQYQAGPPPITPDHPPVAQAPPAPRPPVPAAKPEEVLPPIQYPSRAEPPQTPSVVYASPDAAQSRPAAAQPLSPPPGGPPTPHTADAAEIEYNLGAKVLPWAGAIIMLVAIGFFVSVGIQQGWFTPTLQFASAMIVSWVFIGVGFWKREEREEFGKLLIGIGSCGVYLTLAAGHLFMEPKLYEGEQLVAMFLAWSLVNLAYSYIASSRAFLTIGLLGGLAAALMPLDKGNYTLNVALHFAIILPAFAIAAKNRWSVGVVGIWALSILALMPTLMSLAGGEHATIDLRIWALFGNSLAACLAYGISGQIPESDPNGAFIPSATILAGLGGLGVFADHLASQHLNATTHLVIFGILAAASGFAMREQIAKERFWLGGAVVAAVLSPLDLHPSDASWSFMAIALVGALVSTRFAAAYVLSLAWIDLALSMGYYVAATARENPLPLEVQLLFSIMVTIVVLAWATNRAKEAAEPLVSLAAVLLVVFGSRIVWVSAGDTQNLVRGLYMAFLWIPAAASLATIGRRRGWQTVLGLSWAVYASALVDYFIVASGTALPYSLELTALLLLMAAVVYMGYETYRELESIEPIAAGVSVALIGFGSRIVWISCGPEVADHFRSLYMAFLWIPCAAALTMLGGRRKWDAVLQLGWMVLFAAMADYVIVAEGVAILFRLELEALLFLIATVVFMGIETNRAKASPESIFGFAAVLLVVLSSRVVWVSADHAQPDPLRSLLMAFLWVPVGIVLAAIGAARKWGGVLLLGWLVVLAGTVNYLLVAASVAIPFGMEFSVLLLTIAGAIVAASLTARRADAADAGLSVMTVTLWVLATRLGLLLLSSAAGMEKPWAVTISWTVLAVALLAAGFWADKRTLRFWSLGVFGVTTGKLFLVDLSERIDPLGRVGILAGLGLALLAGGYWYIRSKGNDASGRHAGIGGYGGPPLT